MLFVYYFRSDSSTENFGTIPRRWLGLRKSQEPNFPKLTKEASTSMEDLHLSRHISNAPGTVVRPKSMCVPDRGYYREMQNVCVERIFSDQNVRNQTSTVGSFLNNANNQVYRGANETGVPRNDACNDAVSILKTMNAHLNSSFPAFFLLFPTFDNMLKLLS